MFQCNYIPFIVNKIKEWKETMGEKDKIVYAKSFLQVKTKTM